MHKKKKSADTMLVGGKILFFCREYKEGLPKTVFSVAFQFCFRLMLQLFLEVTDVRSFVGIEREVADGSYEGIDTAGKHTKE